MTQSNTMRNNFMYKNTDCHHSTRDQIIRKMKISYRYLKTDNQKNNHSPAHTPMPTQEINSCEQKISTHRTLFVFENYSTKNAVNKKFHQQFFLIN